MVEPSVIQIPNAPNPTPGKSFSGRRVWIARLIAVAADLLQIAIFPAFFQGIASPFDAGLDLLVAIVLILLLGWHIAFLPTFIIEQLPIADLAPTWTLAVFFVTRKHALLPTNSATKP